MTRKKQKNKKGLLVLVILIVAISVIIFVIQNANGNKKNNEKDNKITVQEEAGIKTNVSEELKKEKTFFGYQISDVVLKEIGGETTFTAKLKNVTDKVIGNESLYIVFKSTTGAELYKMQIYVTEIEPEKTVEINSVITKDIIESYELEIVK